MTYNVFGGTLNPTVVLVYTSVTVTIVWRIRGKIVRTVLYCVPQSYPITCTHVSSSYR